MICPPAARDVRSLPEPYTLRGMHTSRRALTVRAVALAAVTALTLAACGGGSDPIHTVGAAEFKDAIAKPGVTVIDVRTAAEFSAGHIDGAENIDVESDMFDGKIGQLDKTKTYAVYCASGTRSAVAAQRMADAGFPDVYNLEGGVTLWQATGYPLVQ